MAGRLTGWLSQLNAIDIRNLSEGEVRAWFAFLTANRRKLLRRNAGRLDAPHQRRTRFRPFDLRGKDDPEPVDSPHQVLSRDFAIRRWSGPIVRHPSFESRS